jgi:hypothetical protein
MKLRAGFHTIIFITVFGMPCAGIAFDKKIEGRPLKNINFENVVVFELDSIPVRKSGDKKDQERSKGEIKPGEKAPGEIKPGERRPIEEINGDNPRIRQKSGIKQVPRSVPKLKPKSLNDRIPIRRIPIRTPKKGFAGFH